MEGEADCMSSMIPCANECGNAVEVRPGTFRSEPAAIIMRNGKAGEASLIFCSEECIAAYLGFTFSEAEDPSE